MDKLQKKTKFMINVIYYTPDQPKSGFEEQTPKKEETNAVATIEQTDTFVPKN